METAVLWVTLIGGILGIGAIVVKWGPFFQRFRTWLYKHTTRYQIEQLHTAVAALSNLYTLESQHTGAEIKELKEQLALAQHTTKQALLQVLRLQTNANNFFENTATLTEFTAMLDKMPAQLPQPDPEIKKLRAIVNDLVETTAFLLEGQLLRGHPVAQRVKQMAKERADTPD